MSGDGVQFTLILLLDSANAAALSNRVGRARGGVGGAVVLVVEVLVVEVLEVVVVSPLTVILRTTGADTAPSYA